MAREFQNSAQMSCDLRSFSFMDTSEPSAKCASKCASALTILDEADGFHHESTASSSTQLGLCKVGVTR